MTWWVAEDGGTEEVPVPFRFEVSPLESFKTSCYKLNSVAASFDHENHRPATLGAVFAGQCNRTPTQSSNKRVALVWEAWNMSSASSLMSAQVLFPIIFSYCLHRWALWRDQAPRRSSQWSLRCTWLAKCASLHKHLPNWLDALLKWRAGNFAIPPFFFWIATTSVRVRGCGRLAVFKGR